MSVTSYEYNASRFVIPRLIPVNFHALTREQLFGKTAKVDWLTDVALEVTEEVIFYPLTFARKLISLGFEPFPLSYAPRFALFGDAQWFLPNTFAYVCKFGQQYGYCELYNGLGTYGIGVLVHGFAFRNAIKYLDKYWPSLAGESKNSATLVIVPDSASNSSVIVVGENELKVRFRSVMRRYVATAAAIIVSHPFNVVLTRQVAKWIVKEPSCYFFGEMAYTLRVEGFDGIYAGLSSALLTSLVAITGVELGRMLVDKCAEQFDKKAIDPNSAIAQSSSQINDRKLWQVIGAQFVVWPALQIMVNVTNLAMLGATDLVKKLAPGSSAFGNWMDAYKYLAANRLQYRGAYDLLRVHRGSTIKHLDGSYYAKYGI